MDINASLDYSPISIVLEISSSQNWNDKENCDWWLWWCVLKLKKGVKARKGKSYGNTSKALDI